MPGFDRTGPQGMGPMTGGARGLCNPSGPGRGYVGAYGRGLGYGRGVRGGFGPGRGMRWGYGPAYAAPAAAAAYPAAGPEELNVLKAQAADMKNALDEITQRIAELEQED